MQPDEISCPDGCTYYRESVNRVETFISEDISLRETLVVDLIKGLEI